MLTSLIPISFFDEYIISPKTWLHNSKDWQKSFIILLYLSFFYYLNILYTIIIISISLIILINLPIPSKKFILNLNNIIISFFLLSIYSYIYTIQIKII
uniref:hypothetical protein Ycf92 n=1 Tax=Hypnea cervicornis TaxID=387623 RepID=UPI0021B68607|nr:hypothetical protein Ycf92 [Hypnea cervicornis]UVW80749.1 hypothetical protein Ycf92 [Hypnea cervicornis]